MSDTEWDRFVEGHRQQMEDALLPTLAVAQSVGIIPDPSKQLVATYDQMRREAIVRGIKVEYPDGEPPSGTAMKVVTFASPIDGGEVKVLMPADPGAKGLRVRINGVEGVLYSDPTSDEDADDDEVDDAISRALDVSAQQVQHHGDIGLYGMRVNDQLRDELVDAWDNHYQDHGCGAAALMLDRILEQLITAFKEAG